MSAYDDELLEEEDEEMPLTERDLAEDAAWKKIQKNTFTRWANEHLKSINKTITDLEFDLSDGLRLIGLVEVLSGKKFRHVNKRPNFRTQKLENVTKALEFLEKDEGIRIVNIDSGDIVDCKMKLILGLIWTLILHYSISMPMWEGEEEQPSEGGPTPKQRLLNWINGKIPEPVKNFTTDWNDGKAIGALVDAIAPGLCPDWEDWDPKKAKQNAKEAMDAAEKWLDVPQLIKPDEMTNPKVDDLSMMTYLSQFPSAKLKPGAPLRPKQNVGKVRAYGPGLEPKGNRVSQPAKFTVETFSAGKGSLEIKCLDPKGKELPVESVYNNDRNMTYSCSYVPAQEGEHRVIIKFGEKEIHKSPFKVLVEAAAGNASKVTASGPGLEKTGVTVGKKTYFEVFTKDAGKGVLEITILDPSGHRDKVKPHVTGPDRDGVYKVEYTATEVGLHSINILFSGNPIPHSPWGVNVGPALNPKAVYATGRGIQPKGVRVKQNAEFKVHTKDAGKAPVKVQIIGPGGVNINCTVKPSTTEEGVFECVYVPTKVGQYVINITFGDQHITKSPFRVDVGPEKTSKIVAFGPGLEGGVVNQPACFTVETNGEVGALGFSIEGPSQAKIDCKDNGDGSADVTYWPTAPGEYAVHILCNEEDIPQAPYMAQIQPATTAFDASKVTAKGPGLEKDGVLVSKPAEFTVDAKKAGKAKLQITCIDANYKVVEVTVKDNKDGTYSCKYTPKSPVRHTVIITWGSVGIPKSPFRVNVSQPSMPGNVKVYGPGVEKGVKTFVKTHFTVDCRSAGPGDVAIMLTDEKGQDVPVNTKDNKDGTFTIEYEPLTPGMYTVNVYFVGQEIPKSPIKVKVESTIDVGKVTVKGLETPIPIGETRKIMIITSGMPKKDAPCKVTVTTPKKKTVDLTPKKSPEGYTCDFKPTEEGPHQVAVTYDKKPVPDSPFSVNVVSAKKPGEVEVKGLETPIEVGETRPITVVTTSMPKKDAPCKVTCTNPKGKTTELPVKKSPEGYSTSLTPSEPGLHKVSVEFDKKPVPKSPFTVEVQPKGAKPTKAEPGKSEITVKGLDTPVQTGEKRTIIVVTINAAKKGAPCKITATNPKGRTTDLKPKPCSEGFETVFTPWDSGMHKIKIEYDSTEVPGSPFDVEVYKVNLAAIIVKGLEKPIPLGETRKVSVITKDCGKPDLPCKVTAIAPSGQTAEVPTESSPDGYTCNFTPNEPGEYKVKVEYASKELPKSPYKVTVEVAEIKPEKIKPEETAPSKAAPGSQAPTDAKKPSAGGVTVKGLDTPVNPGEKRQVIVDTTQAPKKHAPCKLTATNPKGRKTELKTKEVPDGFETTFSSWDKGTHTVVVEYDSKEIPDSPFAVLVEKIDVSKVTVEGLDTPIQLGETRKISILTTGSGKVDAPCKVLIKTPKGETMELPTQPNPDGYTTDFKPKDKGKHIIEITYAYKEVPKSPFEVLVQTLNLSGVKVKGLEKPIMVSERRSIEIITTPTGKKDLPCKVQVTNPKGKVTELPTHKTNDGHETTFTPSEIGPHKVKIEVADEEVPGSEFPVEVTKFEQKITVDGLDTPILAGEKRTIKVNTGTTAKPNRFAPEPTCKITVTNPKGRNFEPLMDKKSDGFETFYSSNEPGPHIFKIEHNGKEIPESPITCDVEKLEPRKVDVKGLETPIEVGETRPIAIVTKDAGKPDLPCKVQAIGPKGDTKDLPTKPNPDGYETTYAPLETGPHKIKVEYAGREIPKSPIPVEVKPKSKDKPTKVDVKGLETPVTVGEKRPVKVTTGKPDAPCKITQTTPKGKSSDVPTKKVPDGYEATFAPLEEGPYKVKVEHAGKDVPGSPFSVDVKPKVDLSKVEVKGLEKPIKVGEARPISIITKSTGIPDAPCKVTAISPKGQPTDCPTTKTKDGYETVFSPKEKGPHKVKVELDKKEVPKSPYDVTVEPSVDLAKVDIKGLETPVEVDEIRHFTVVTKATGDEDAPCKAISTNPNGQTFFLPAKKVQEGFDCTFTPKEKGPHKVKVEVSGKEVPKSPITVDVVDKFYIKNVEVKGLDEPIKLGETRPILIETTSCGKPDAPCKVFAKGPYSPYEQLPTKKTKDGFECAYTPKESGPNSVKVEYNGKELPKSPYVVKVESDVDISKVAIKGLESPIEVGEPRPITVMTSTTGKPDAPCKVAVTNPAGKTVELPTRKIPEGYTATLAPQEVGPHKVKVDFNNQPVPKSPFSVMAVPAIDYSKVKVTGLEKPVEVGEKRPVKVETAECGVVDAPCQLTATNPEGLVRDLPVKKTPKGYEAEFAPREVGSHLVAVKYAGNEVPKSPFSVQATPQGPPASKVKAYGPGLESGMATKPCSFTIDTTETTQPGGLGVTVEGPAESKIECRDNQDGTCDVTYYPTVPGDYNINITYADEHIPKSPFKAGIVPSGDIDVSGVKAYGPGLEPGVFLDSPTGFTVDAKSVTPEGAGKVRAIVTSPSGQRTESLVKNKGDGTYDVLYTPYEQGPNTIDITYEDVPIPQSPVKVEATPGCDASRVKAYGPGLEGGLTDQPQVFTVDVKGAGQGGLALAIDGPAETQINCKDNRDGTCEVEYIPVKKGDYDITVKFADQHIPGSPFHVGIQNPVNPAKVKCYGPGVDSKEVKTNAPATFTVDTTEAGEAPLDVTYTDKNGAPIPAEIVPLEAGKYQATYYPVDEGKCKVEVKYANQHVPNSPFNMRVEPGVDAKKVRLSGDGLHPTVLASMPVEFVVDTREAGDAPIDVEIQRPDGTSIRPMIQDNRDGTYTVKYTPEDCGPYDIKVFYGDEPVTDAPIRTTAVPTGDASKCRITEGLQPTIPVEKETVITVDASQAGTGKVTCRIRSPQGTEIDIDIIENIDGTFSISFTPAFPGDYSINIKFGGQSIPNGDYVVQVGEDLIQADTVDSTQAAAPGAGLYYPQEFNICAGPIFNFVTAYIVMPSGKKAYPKIEDNKDGSVTIRYQPQETGLHELYVCYNQQAIQGSPFKFHVDAVNSGFVTAYGPGLSHGVVNVPAEFTIVTKDAGAGGLSLAIEGPSKTEIKCKDNEDGTCTVTYLPTAPGEYNITVKFADKNISGSPFVAKVTAGEPKQKAQIGRSSEVSLKITETDIANLTASILSPSGHEEPCMLKRLPNGHLGISFTPRETGEHLVNVFRDGQHIANSPFRITVGESELGNAGKVKVYGKGLKEAMANEVNEFIVDTREAGYGGLSLSIEGPSKADIECHDNEDGTCRVTYKPTEPGTYIINIKFADEHVPGSPFKVKVGGEASEKITERIMRHREAADITHVGSECELSLKIPGTSPFDMTASVTSPSGVTELCDVVSLDDCHYSIKFVPKEMGIHTVSVKHKDMHIPGSPFQFTVGPIAGGGAHKVHAAGMGLVRGEVDQPNEFNIYTREAGAGGLSIAVEGPSKAEVDFEDRKDGSCGVTYTVSEPGEYLISIKFNDEHIPDSPFRVPITPSIGDAKKISVSALQSKGLQIGKPCSFVVNFNGAPKGKLQARVVSPSGAEDDALVQEIDDGEYAVRFIPRENGPHLVYVSFNGCQIPDSPFRIQVGTIYADPGMVQAYGEGLKTGKTDQTAKFIVNTVNAGSGALAVTVEGPSKVKMECREVDEGYEFTYTPTAPGDYLITIKYAGTNIAGSPFKARIEGQGKPSGYQEQASVVVETVTKTSVMSKFASLQPFESDASKVTCDGNGLKKGYRNKQCTFNVDTSKAGNNMLFIGMIGPKGPCEELCVKHQPGAPYKITYLVKERGDYMLAVKWGDEHIPGSPFYVKVE